MAENGFEIPYSPVKSNTESQADIRPGKGVTRRTVLGGLAAAAGAFIFGKPKSAEAQMRPIPGSKPDESAPPAKPENKPGRELPPPPSDVKNLTDKAIKLLSPFMNNVSEIKAQYFASGTPNAHTSYEYSSKDGEEVNMHKYSLMVLYPSDGKFSGDLELVVKQQLAVLSNKTFNSYPSESFARDFKQYTGVDIKPAVRGVTKLSAEPLAQNQARLAELSRYLDLSEYKKSPAENLGSSSGNISEKLYADIVAQFFSNKDIKARIKNIPESDRKIVACLYLAALKRAADCYGIGNDFKNSGVNQKAVDDLLQISGNETYQKYFAEKRNPTSANKIRLVDSEDYRAFITRSAQNAA